MTLTPDSTPPILAYSQPTLPIPEGWTNPRVYGYLPDKAAALFHMRAARYLAFLTLFIPLMLFLQWKVLAMDHQEAMLRLCVLVGFFTCAAAFRIWRMKRLIDRQWPTFRLIIADQGLARICQGFPDLIIPFAELKQVREYPSRGISLRGRNRLQIIWVALKYVEGYAEIRDHLAAVTPMETYHRRWLLVTRQVMVILLLLAVLFGSWIWGVFSTDLRVELLCFSVSLSLVVWSNVTNWRNPNIMLRQKIGSLILVLLPLELLAKIFWVHR